MQITRAILFAGILGCSLYAMPAEAFRCGNRIVSEGDDISHVYYICGEPSATQHWTEVRVRPVYRYTNYRAVHLPVEIQVEEWTYNLGSRRFMRRLRFENGRLVRIRELRYGY
ncbi:MAG: DUF2845 domain-containing protein [Gammaproteobacteria bacterium]|nr:DUF2845 domain-containing protein [Gammaproteobacteria bacterium]MDH3769020.1 DUF2845 domain-containing protein [Gammaproteobacteria bacterium]